MSEHDEQNEGDEQVWGPVTPDAPYTLSALDFIGIGLNGLALGVSGFGNGLHYMLQVSAREFFMAAEGRRRRNYERAEQAKLAAYATTLDHELKGL